MENKAREVGTVAMWQGDRGFGFIKPDKSGEKDIFAHVSECPDNLESLSKGERVTYARKVGQRGLMAVAIELEKE